MGINIADNFAYNGKKPMDNRTEYTTLATMKAVVDANINEGCLAYNKEDGKYYKFLSTNTVDATTGKWREFETGGGGQTYNDFTGATASTAGAHGLVPAPSAGDEGKVLRGDGTWATLVTGYDWSSNSVESDILSLTEKPIGQWTDGKILYQKMMQIEAPNDDDAFVSVGASIDYGEILYCSLINGKTSSLSWGTSTSNTIVNVTDTTKLARLFVLNNENNDFGNEHKNTLRVFNNWSAIAGRPILALVRYTKTTDSPLASDEKFAGLLSDGTPYFKKEINLGALPNNNTKTVAHGITNIGEIWLGEAYGINTDKLSVPLPYVNAASLSYAIQIYVDGTNIYIITKDDNSFYNGHATIYYTLAS